MKIGTIAKQSGVPASTIRYYEEIGLLPTPPRVSGQRHYDAQVLMQLRGIKLAQATGFSLQEIQSLFADNHSHQSAASNWRARAQQKLVEIEHIMAQYQAMQHLLRDGLACDCITFENCALVDAFEPNAGA